MTDADARILDRGYRRYDGPRSGQLGAVRSLIAHSSATCTRPPASSLGQGAARALRVHRLRPRDRLRRHHRSVPGDTRQRTGRAALVLRLLRLHHRRDRGVHRVRGTGAPVRRPARPHARPLSGFAPHSEHLPAVEGRSGDGSSRSRHAGATPLPAAGPHRSPARGPTGPQPCSSCSGRWCWPGS